VIERVQRRRPLEEFGADQALYRREVQRQRLDQHGAHGAAIDLQALVGVG
jgi:hypothetical protein